MTRTTSTVRPDAAERAAIEAIAASCDRADATATDIDFDTSLNYRKAMPSWFFAWDAKDSGSDEEEIVGFLSVFAPEAETAEITAMVLPERRRRGIFAALLGSAEAALRSAGYRSLLFVRDAASAPGGAVIAGWGARRGAVLDHREFSMVLGAASGAAGKERLPSGPAALPRIKVERGGRGDLEDLVALSVLAFGDDEAESRGFLETTLAIPARTILVARAADGPRDGESAGALGMLSVFVEGEIASLNALVVRPDARRKGIGSLLLDRGIALAEEKGATRIGLEVDALNRGALGLYLRRGFAVVSEEEYWRVAL